MNRPTRLIVFCFLSAAIAGGVGYWFGQRPAVTAESPATDPVADTAPEPIPVQTARVEIGTLSERASAYGIVQPKPAAIRTYSIPFEGAVQSVAIAPGERVAAGATLAVLGASADTQLQYEQAKNALASAQETSKQTTRRVEEQLATNTEAAAAEQAVKAAQTQLDNLNARGVTGPRTITSDVAGVVDQVNVQPGQVAPAGSPLVTVRPEHEVEVKLGVSPTLATSISPEQAMTLSGVTPASAKGTTAATEPNDVVSNVRFVSPQLNAQSRLVDVYVSIPADAALPLGTFVTGTFTVRSVEGVIVPRNATRLIDGEWYVFIFADGKAQQRAVTLDVQQDDRIEVNGDIHEGDAVITTTNGELEDGVAVEIETSDATDAADHPTTAEGTK